MDDNALINQNEVAKMLCVSPRLVLKLARVGIIPALKVGKFVRFKRSSIQRWIKENEKCNKNQNKDNEQCIT